MPPKKEITVKLESAICERVEELCEIVEKRLKTVKLDGIDEIMFNLLKELFRLNSDNKDKMEEMIMEMVDLLGRDKFDLYNK